MLADSIDYVVSANGFWSAMGWVSACGIFVGVIIHNGDLKSLWKGILSFGFYAMLISYTTYIRVMGRELGNIFDRHPNSTASFVTNIIVGWFYLLGLILGVISIKTAHWWWKAKPIEVVKKKLKKLMKGKNGN